VDNLLGLGVLSHFKISKELAEFRESNFQPHFATKKIFYYTTKRSLGITSVLTHQEKAPRHCVQVKRSLVSIFWKSQVYLDYSIATDKNRQIRACRFELKLSS